jgi:hypothetical protein
MEVRNTLNTIKRLPHGGEVVVIPFGLQVEWMTENHREVVLLIKAICGFYSHAVPLVPRKGGALISWESPSYRVLINVKQQGGKYSVLLSRVDRH